MLRIVIRCTRLGEQLNPFYMLVAPPIAVRQVPLKLKASTSLFLFEKFGAVTGTKVPFFVPLVRLPGQLSSPNVPYNVPVLSLIMSLILSLFGAVVVWRNGRLAGGVFGGGAGQGINLRYMSILYI